MICFQGELAFSPIESYRGSFYFSRHCKSTLCPFPRSVGILKYKALNVTLNVMKLRYVNSRCFFVQDDNAFIIT